MSTPNENFYLFGKIAIAAARFKDEVTLKDVKRSINDFAAISGLGNLPIELQQEFDAIASESSTPENSLDLKGIAQRICDLCEKFRLILEIEEIEG